MQACSAGVIVQARLCRHICASVNVQARMCRHSCAGIIAHACLHCKRRRRQRRTGAGTELSLMKTGDFDEFFGEFMLIIATKFFEIFENFEH